MKQTISSSSDEQTQTIGEKFASTVKPGDVLCLFGDLGAGKTTFTKGFARGLGIKDRIISPTFTLVREHEVQKSEIKKLYHIDLYRLENAYEIENIGLSEILREKDAVILIEWAEKLENKLPENRIEIHFEHKKDNSRDIIIEHF